MQTTYSWSHGGGSSEQSYLKMEALSAAEEPVAFPL